MKEADREKFVCHRVAGSFHWELKLLGLKVGTKELDTHETPLMLMDTGTSISYLPKRDYDRLLA